MTIPSNYDIDAVFKLAGFPYGKPVATKPENFIEGGVNSWNVLTSLFTDTQINYIADNIVALNRSVPTTSDSDTIFDYMLAGELLQYLTDAGYTPLGRDLDATSLSYGDVGETFDEGSSVKQQQYRTANNLRNRARYLINVENMAIRANGGNTMTNVKDGSITVAKLAVAVADRLLPATIGSDNQFLRSDGTKPVWESVNVGSGNITDGSVTTSKLADDAVSVDKLANAIVARLLPSSIGSDNQFLRSDGSNPVWETVNVGSGNITDGSVTTAKLADDAVSIDKLANAVAARLLPSSIGSNDQFLRSDGSNPVWETINYLTESDFEDTDQTFYSGRAGSISEVSDTERAFIITNTDGSAITNFGNSNFDFSTLPNSGRLYFNNTQGNHTDGFGAEGSKSLPTLNDNDILIMQSDVPLKKQTIKFTINGNPTDITNGKYYAYDAVSVDDGFTVSNVSTYRFSDVVRPIVRIHSGDILGDIEVTQLADAIVARLLPSSIGSDNQFLRSDGSSPIWETVPPEVDKEDTIPFASFFTEKIDRSSVTPSLTNANGELLVSSNNTKPDHAPSGTTDFVAVDINNSSGNSEETLLTKVGIGDWFRVERGDKYIIAKIQWLEKDNTNSAYKFWFNPSTDIADTFAYDSIGAGSANIRFSNSNIDIIQVDASDANALPTVSGTTKIAIIAPNGRITYTTIDDLGNHIVPQTTAPFTVTQTFDATPSTISSGSIGIFNPISQSGIGQLIWYIPDTLGNNISRQDVLNILNRHHSIEIYTGSKVIKGKITSYSTYTGKYYININPASQVGTFTDGETVTVQLQSDLVDRDELGSLAYKNTVSTSEITDDAVTNAKLADDAVDTDQVKDDAIAVDKLANAVVSRLLPSTIGSDNQVLTSDGTNAVWETPSNSGGGGGVNIKSAQITSGSASSTISDAGLSVSITPSTSSKKILLTAIGGYLQVNGDGTAQELVVYITDNSNNTVAIGNYRAWVSTGEGFRGNISVSGIHSPNTTNSVTYKVRWAAYNSPAAAQASANNPLVLTAIEID